MSMETARLNELNGCAECGRPTSATFCSDQCEQRFLESSEPSSSGPLTASHEQDWDSARFTNRSHKR
jgi:hypothetical protein